MRFVIALILLLTSLAQTHACPWDYDTPRMERSAFPGALELIVGKFLRHSDPFYQWRIDNRSAQIAAHHEGTAPLDDKQLAATYDDWAVALDKLGRHDEAIDVINDKANRLPNTGRYKTLANRGTFLIHAGRVRDGIEELNKALEINPDAHFGREEYQVLLAEYVLEKRGESEQVRLPLDDSQRHSRLGGRPFADWILRRKGLAESRNQERIAAELNRARKGVMGMMQFGNHESPILLEALGDLLWTQRDVQGQRLAARAYLRAAEESPGQAARESYHRMAEQSLSAQLAETNGGANRETLSLNTLENQLARERKEAITWFSHLAEDEALWIEKSTDPNPDERFWQKYGTREIEVGQTRLPPARFVAEGLPWPIRIALAATGLITALLVVGLLIWRGKRPTGY